MKREYKHANPALTIPRQAKNIEVPTYKLSPMMVKALGAVIGAYLYYDRFCEQYTSEDRFYYANARAAGRVLKYILPVLLIPVSRMLRHAFSDSEVSQRFSVDGKAIHKLLGISMTAMASVHTVAHVANRKGTIDMTEQEWITGIVMMTCMMTLITAGYYDLFKTRKAIGYNRSFLQPHQLGTVLLLLCYAAHTKDFRLSGAAAIAGITHGTDKLYKWLISHGTTVTKLKHIHRGMSLVTLQKPKGYSAQPGDYALVTKHNESILNDPHPFTIAGINENEVQFLISKAGSWTAWINKEAKPKLTKLRITSAYASPLTLSSAQMGELMFISSGSGLAMTTALLKGISATENKKKKPLSIFHVTRNYQEFTELKDVIGRSSQVIKPFRLYLTGGGNIPAKGRKKLDPNTKEAVIKGRFNPKDDSFFKAYKGHVFFCGNPQLGQALKEACADDPGKTLHIESFS